MAGSNFRQALDQHLKLLVSGYCAAFAGRGPCAGRGKIRPGYGRFLVRRSSQPLGELCAVRLGGIRNRRTERKDVISWSAQDRCRFAYLSIGELKITKLAQVQAQAF